MNTEKLFQSLSYAAVLCGFFALWISGIFGIVGTGLFVATLVGGWFLEGTKWQVKERPGTVLIVLALPVYYALYKYGYFPLGSSGSPLPGVLARLIVSLSAIKMLQRKSDRDWIFLYVMSFFQVLLAAGLSISPLYFASFIAYIFVMVCAVVLFEIRKTSRDHLPASNHKLDQLEQTKPQRVLPARRIPAAATILIVFIIVLATPMFFLLPRVGGAGFGGNMTGGAETRSGFSDTVRLGRIGDIQENDQIVMRVRLEGHAIDELTDIRWRGIALDTFDNQTWKKSKPGYPDRLARGGGELTQVEPTRGRGPFVLQTVYLEPVNSAVMFVLPRAVGVQSSMPFLMRDMGGSLAFPSRGERISYRVLSETAVPETRELRRDNGLYAAEYHNYLQLPDELDPRIAELATEITRNTRTRYDASRAIESYLQTQFAYTLEQKAGGDQPLADFLFNIRQGHCEYFATAMAVMLRTQGIATRVVNGFQRGEYNETADVFVVRQRNAHSWVEVFFPEENAWVTFDPTPFAGQNLTGDAGGLMKTLNSYVEAFETFWIQYFVAYDSAEQRSLLSSVRRGMVSYGKQTSTFLDTAQDRLIEWWQDVRGDAGAQRSVVAVAWATSYLVAAGVLIVILVKLRRRIVKSTIWQRLRNRWGGRNGASAVEFYERLQLILAGRGLVRQPHQTPLEFAYATGLEEAVNITEAYNGVRYGLHALSGDEAKEIAEKLARLEIT